MLVVCDSREICSGTTAAYGMIQVSLASRRSELIAACLFACVYPTLVANCPCVCLHMSKADHIMLVDVLAKGPLLEQEGLDIGIVTGIAAPAALTIEFTGAGGHAGALLMHFR
eukprot:scaffold95501_cov15-Tisochrysis_lutea.AAC.1